MSLFKSLNSFIGICAIVAMVAILFAPSPAHANKKYASIVIDANTGTVLRARNADKKLHPASLTKMMTLYMTFEALENGKLSLNRRIWVSPHAASMVPSKLGLKPRSTIRVEDAMYALVTKSANDAAVALAEAIGGTESGFARKMTQKARFLGMSSTTFKNASGLHHKRQVSTARDMARLSQALIHHYPHRYKIFSTNQFKYAGKNYRNHNRLMKTYTGMDGIKTGYINAAGFNLAASAKRDGQRLIGVVFGGRTSKSRNAHMAQIMDEGFAKARRMGFALARVTLPTAKPQKLLFASLQTNKNVPQNIKVAEVSAGYVGNEFQPLGLVVGEGDQDPEATAQIMAAMKDMSRSNGGIRPSAGTNHPMPTPREQVADLNSSGWTVQIGAFDSAESSTAALKQAAQKLPRSYVMNSRPQIVKAKSGGETIYRARFAGLSRQSAVQGCNIIKNCLVLAASE